MLLDEMDGVDEDENRDMSFVELLEREKEREGDAETELLREWEREWDGLELGKEECEAERPEPKLNDSNWKKSGEDEQSEYCYQYLKCRRTLALSAANSSSLILWVAT